MLKRIFATLSLIISFTSASIASDTDIRFSVLPIDGEISDRAAKIFAERIEQGLSRSNALSDNPYEVLSIKPVITIENVAQTEGLVREIAVITGELRLSAVNDIDGTTYHTAIIPLKASAVDGKDKAMEKMALSVKSTDPVFVRFVRQSRQKIEEYYADNCSKIMAVAKQLADTDKGHQALAYLAGISPSVECYDIASVMINDLAATNMPQTPDIADINNIPVDTDPVVARDTIYIEKVVEAPSQPAAETRPEQTPAKPKPARDYTISGAPKQPSKSRDTDDKPTSTITIDSDDLKIKVLSCKGNETTQRIDIVLEVVNENSRVDFGYAKVAKAFENNGLELTDNMVKGSDGKWRNFAGINMPCNIPLKMNVYLSGDKKIKKLSYVELMIRTVKIIIKDLPVSW